ncbi:MAG: helix-turn-helix domain-containing protein [Cyanobacteria bacterium Co-bin8]|nr:helix-turn-helix domain-containing protein [Cyanobacteria bacterium Co-bin8]
MAKLASTQIEQLREIGAYLRQIRQQQGRGLDDIANQIFIRPALLRAVEEGQEQQLPEPVFIQGFIRRYGEALGLDGSELSKEFSVTAAHIVSEPHSNGNGLTNGHTEVEMRPPVQEARQPVQETRQPLQETRQPIQFPHDPPVPERGVNRRQSGLPLGLAAGALVLVAGAALGIWSLANRPNQASVANSSQSATAAPEAVTPDPVPVPVPTPAATPEPTSNAPVVADLSMRDRAWISVVADGQKVYEGILESGTEETYEAQSSLRITSGNAGGVALSFNGSAPVSMGASGTVRTLTLTPETDPATLAVP